MTKFVATLLPTLVPVVFIAVGVLLLVGVVQYQRWRDRRYPRQSPLTQNMLRPPGHSLRQKLESLDVESDTCLVFFFMTPLAVFAVHVSQSYFAGEPESVLRVVTSIVMAGAILAVVGRYLLHLMSERKKFALGLEGELVTGEELNQLMLDGCRVFHDIPFQYGNIDHVVVSCSGVFSVNAKLWGKPKEGGNSEIVVDHQRNMIHFPDRQVPIRINQLEGEARWLAEYLSKSVGQRLEVEPMLALPGWFAKQRIGRGSVYVFNPRKPSKFFVQNRTVLSPQQIEQVAHQLEQLCRDVEPKYREKKGW